MYKVRIVSFENEAIIKEVSCKTEHEANKVQRGMDINLNHDKFYTIVVKD